MELYATHRTSEGTDARLADLPAPATYKEPEPPSAFMKICLQEAVTSHSELGQTAFVLPPFLLRRDRLGLSINDFNQVIAVIPCSWAAAAGVMRGDTVVQASEQHLEGRKLAHVLASLRERDVQEVHLVVARPIAAAAEAPAHEAEEAAAPAVPLRVAPRLAAAPSGHRDVAAALQHARAQQQQESRLKTPSTLFEDRTAPHLPAWCLVGLRSSYSPQSAA